MPQFTVEATKGGKPVTLRITAESEQAAAEKAMLAGHSVLKVDLFDPDIQVVSSGSGAPPIVKPADNTNVLLEIQRLEMERQGVISRQNTSQSIRAVVFLLISGVCCAMGDTGIIVGCVVFLAGVITTLISSSSAKSEKRTIEARIMRLRQSMNN